MKNSILFFMFFAFGLSSAFAQGDLKLGVNGGIPVGDAEEFTNFQLGADVAYMFNLVETFEVGPMIGYSHYFGDSGTDGDLSFEVEDVQFIPLAVTGRVRLLNFFAGTDLGYAIGINDGNDGGFYYRPHLGYELGLFGLLISYSGTSSDGATLASVNLGVEFGL